MGKYILRRLLLLIPVMIGVTIIVFTINYFTPGDPARVILGNDAKEEEIQQYREELGLNDPYFVQLGRYIWNIVAHGDMGTSYVTGQPVFEEIMDRFPTTFMLASLSVIFATIIGIPLGIISAVKQYSVFDMIVTVLALVGASMPHFWLGLMLILAFSVKINIFPATGFYGPIYWVLPMITLGVHSISTITRMTRSSMLDVIRADYIRTARSKGLTEWKIITKHALKNALIPVVTVIGMNFAASLGGATVTETIFTIPGLGKMMVDGIKSRNYPVIQGGVLWLSLAFSVMTLIIDLIYAFIDPRIKAQYSAGKKKSAPKEEKKENKEDGKVVS